MPLDDVWKRLRAECAGALGVEEREVTPAARLVADLGAESIDLVDLTFRIEKAFGITIPENELFDDPARRAETWRVADVADYVASRMGA